MANGISYNIQYYSKHDLHDICFNKKFGFKNKISLQKNKNETIKYLKEKFNANSLVTYYIEI